jgi:hypothetical protein
MLRRFDNFGTQQETRQDSVSHQFKSFAVLHWPLKEKQNWNPSKTHLNAFKD